MGAKRLFALIVAGLIMATEVVLAITIHVPDDQPTIQQGIDAAIDGDTVLVAPGTYFENINFKGKAIVVRSADGWTQTTIDGMGQGSVVRFESGEDSTSVLEGFTIQGGNADFPGFVGGGGLLCRNSSSPVINECDINNNYAGVLGGGVACRDSSAPSIVECIIRNNSGGGSHFGIGGGGIACFGHSHLTLVNCRVERNEAVGVWGGFGGAILCDNSFMDLVNCTVTQNTGFSQGGIRCQGNSELNIYKCTIASNWPIGLVLLDSSRGTLTNSIVWTNTEGGLRVGYDASINIRYCDIQEMWAGIGNISVDPLFVDSENGDFHLQCKSPCIDAGDPESPFDPDDTRADMGAFYFDKNEYNIKGDINIDCEIDVVDVIKMVCILLKTCEYDEGMFFRADWNADGEVNILDVVGLIQYILEGTADIIYVPFKDVEDYGTFCVTERGTAVITSNSEWMNLWELYWNSYDDQGNKTPPPEINFGEEMVIGVFWGGECVYSGCTNESPSIETVWISRDTLWVKVGQMKDLGPCDMCVCPLHLIQTQKYGLPVKFIGDVP